MNPLESLELLEDKIHYLAVRLTQISEENLQLKDEIEKERRRNKSLTSELGNLKEEREQFQIIKQSVRKKIEALIEQLSSDQDLSEKEEPKAPPHYLTLEETQALNKPLTDDILSDTPIRFFPEEDI